MRTPDIIRKLREEEKLTKGYIAKRLGIVQQTYSNYERGNTEVPLGHLSKLADYYGVSIDYMMGRTSFRKPATELNEEYSRNKTTGAVLSEMLRLEADSREDLLDYMEFLQMKEAWRRTKQE